MLHGLLLMESLADTQVLDLIQVSRTETWQVENIASYQPSVWTAISFEVETAHSDSIATALSQALKPAWFINASTETHVFVVFPNRVFKYIKGDIASRQAAREYGISLGIPEHQLDWDEYVTL